MKLKNLIYWLLPFEKGSVVGSIGYRNYYVYVGNILILELDEKGLVVWFNNDYYSETTSKIQNIVCKLLNLPKKRIGYNLYRLPKYLQK